MVDGFIERQNIAKFTNLLLKETDPVKRELLTIDIKTGAPPTTGTAPRQAA